MVEIVKTQLRQPKFEQGMEGVLELAESVDLTSALLAADLDVRSPQHVEAATATVSSTLTFTRVMSKPGRTTSDAEC